MRYVLFVMLMSTAVVQAQGVRQEAVTPDDLLLLFDNALALEVDIPAGATTFALSYGNAADPFGFSTFITESGARPAPTRLRVVVVLADPAVVDACAADEAQAVVIAVPHGDEWADFHQRQSVCVQHPPKSAITGEARTVIEGSAPQLNTWTPLVFQTWLVNAGKDAQGGIDSAVDLTTNFLVQVHFGDSNDTGTVMAPPLNPAELIVLPTVGELIEEYGLLTGP